MWRSLESWEQLELNRLVQQYVRDYSDFKPWEAEIKDICEEHWRKQSGRYVSQKGTREGFMRTVVRNRLRDLARQRASRKYQHDYLKKSLSEDIPAGETNALYWEELSLHIDRLEGGMTVFQRRICRMLKEGGTISRMSQELGCDRKTVRTEILRIRGLFETAGLKDFL